MYSIFLNDNCLIKEQTMKEKLTLTQKQTKDFADCIEKHGHENFYMAKDQALMWALVTVRTTLRCFLFQRLRSLKE